MGLLFLRILIVLLRNRIWGIVLYRLGGIRHKMIHQHVHICICCSNLHDKALMCWIGASTGKGIADAQLNQMRTSALRAAHQDT